MRRQATTGNAPQTPTNAPGDRLIQLPEVRARIPIDRSTIWRMTREGRFPAPVDLGLRRLAWRESEINRWIAERAAARHEEAVPA